MIVTVQAVVMLFGAFAAAAGLLLLFLRKEEGRNQIKLFGQEFEISTPALVVFLCGCFIFVAPMLRPTEQLNRPMIILGSTAAGKAGLVPGSGNIQIGGEEEEPNDQITDANEMQFGSRVRGVSVAKGDRDYFKFHTPDGPLEKIRVILRKLRSGGFYGRLTLYDATEARLTGSSAPGDDPVSLSFAVSPKSTFCVLVTADDGFPAQYELEVRSE